MHTSNRTLTLEISTPKHPLITLRLALHDCTCCFSPPYGSGRLNPEQSLPEEMHQASKLKLCQQGISDHVRQLEHQNVAVPWLTQARLPRSCGKAAFPFQTAHGQGLWQHAPQGCACVACSTNNADQPLLCAYTCTQCCIAHMQEVQHVLPFADDMAMHAVTERQAKFLVQLHRFGVQQQLTLGSYMVSAHFLEQAQLAKQRLGVEVYNSTPVMRFAVCRYSKA